MKETRTKRFLNLLIFTVQFFTFEKIDGYLDLWYNTLKAMRKNMAIRNANSLHFAHGKQYHVIPVKLKKMWITRYEVVTREDIKHNKRLGLFRPSFQVEDILKLSCYSTPSRHTYHSFIDQERKRRSLERKIIFFFIILIILSGLLGKALA